MSDSLYIATGGVKQSLRSAFVCVLLSLCFLFSSIDLLADTGVGESGLEGTGQAPVPRSLEVVSFRGNRLTSDFA